MAQMEAKQAGSTGTVDAKGRFTLDPPGPPVSDFQAQYKAHMAKLGAKGGKVSGAKRMEMPVEERRRIASLAARAMWAKRKGGKKR